MKTVVVQHFVFGYGSLLCRHSRLLTLPSSSRSVKHQPQPSSQSQQQTQPSTIIVPQPLPLSFTPPQWVTKIADSEAGGVPVRVYGLQRLWGKRSRSSRMTSAGVRWMPMPMMQQQRPGCTHNTLSSSCSSCLGLLLPLGCSIEKEAAEEEAEEMNEENAVPHPLALLDAREIGYTRHRLLLSRVELVHEVEEEEEEEVDHDNKMNWMDVEDTLSDFQKEIHHRAQQKRHRQLYKEAFAAMQRLERQQQQQDDHPNPNHIHQEVRVWVYMPNDIHLPSPDYPIVQSYVDTILRGCIALGPRFVTDFLTNTHGWMIEKQESDDDVDETDASSDSEGYHLSSSSTSSTAMMMTKTRTKTTSWMINDRADPRYKRGDPRWFRAHSRSLDALLQHYLPHSSNNPYYHRLRHHNNNSHHKSSKKKTPKE